LCEIQLPIRQSAMATARATATISEMEIQGFERGKRWKYRACPPKPWRRLVRAACA